MGRFIDYKNPLGDIITLAFIERKYKTGGFAIEVACKGPQNDGYWEPYGNLTVNLSGENTREMAHMDTNNMDDIIDFCLEKGWLGDIMDFKDSGFVTYPLISINEQFIKEIMMSESEFIEKRKADEKQLEVKQPNHPLPGESLEEWAARVGTATDQKEFVTLFLPLGSETLDKPRARQYAVETIEAVFEAEGIELGKVDIRERGHELGGGAYVTVPSESRNDALNLGRSIYLEVQRTGDRWAHVKVGNIGLEKDFDPSKENERKGTKMTEEVKKEFVNVEFPASCVKRGWKSEDGAFHEFANKETGEKFCKCYFPEGMEVGGQSMDGFYLSPNPEYIRPSGFRLGAMQWGYKNDPEKKIWAFRDIKNEDGTYGEREHVELDPAAIEKACRDFMEVPDNKEFIRVDASRVHERNTKEGGRTFFAAKGPNLNVDGVDLSKYEITANYHTAPKDVNGVETVIFYAVKGEQIKMNPPYGVEGAKPVYIQSETLAKGYNADINRKAERMNGAEAKTKEAPAHAKDTQAKTIAPTKVQNAPRTTR